MSDETPVDLAKDVKIFDNFDDVVVHALACVVYKKEDPSQEELDFVDAKLDKFRKKRATFCLSSFAENVFPCEGRPSIESMFDFYGLVTSSKKNAFEEYTGLPIDDDAIKELLGIEVIDQRGGGEGGAEDCYSIFSYLGVYYRINYRYYSHQGFEFWNTDIKRAFPRKIEIIAWFDTP